MPPGLSRLMNLQPITALLTSLACIFLLRKGYEHAPIMIIFVFFAFFYLTFRLRIQKRGGILPKMWDTALLFMINDMIIFVMPFYFESMTFPSRNMVFAPVLLFLAVLAHWYRLYQRVVLPYPMIGSIFYSLTFFCVLNFIFPVFLGMRNQWSLLLSGIIASISVIIFINPHIPVLRHRKNAVLSLIGIALFLAVLWFGRSAIPPAPLMLVNATACSGVTDLMPVNPFTAAGAGAFQEVYFFSSIYAPRGLREKIYHTWYHDGEGLFSVNLREIYGGRKQGFRTWSRHTILEGPGKYTVEVWTEGGQLVGSRNFYLR